MYIFIYILDNFLIFTITLNFCQCCHFYLIYKFYFQIVKYSANKEINLNNSDKTSNIGL